MEKLKFAEHQWYGIEIFDSNPAVGLFYPAGSGKTAIALKHCYDRVMKAGFTQILVVCPAALVPTWMDHIDRFINFEGVTEKGLARLKKAITVRSFQKMYKSEKLSNGRRKLSIRPDIDHKWDVLICDEAHYLGNHSSLQSKTARTLAMLSKERYLMTGTPVHGSGRTGADWGKLYGQMRILEPDIWKTWGEFCKRYVKSFDYWGNPESYDEASLRVLMENHGIVCTLEQVIDLPGVSEQVISCPLTETKMYKEVGEGIVKEIGLEIENAGGQYLKLLQVCSGSIKTDTGTLDLKTSKDDALRTLLDGTDDKVVVFCNFKASIRRCTAICEKEGRKVCIMDGDHPKDSWKQFQYGDCDVIICQYQSGAAGLDLFTSHTMVFYDVNFSTEKYTQARARIYRKGQTRHCLYYILCTPGTVEAKAWNTVRHGESVSTNMLRDWALEEFGELPELPPLP